MNIHVFDTKEILYDAVLQYYKNHLNRKPNSVLGLATGSTPLPLYQRFIKDYQDSKIDFSQVITYNLDEYVGLEDNHKASYHVFMQDNLFKNINIDSKSIHMPSITKGCKMEEAINQYQNDLDKHQIDIQLLGIGTNGHIGFNEPNTPFDTHTFLVTLDEKTRKDNARFFMSFEEVPTHAVTMGIADIMKAKTIVVIATGAQKAKAVYGMIKGPVTESLPASILQKHNDVHIFLDKEAAKLVKKEEL